MAKAELDCTKCGACCMGQLIMLSSRDHPPFMMIEIMEPQGLNVMRQQHGRCIALHGRLAIDTTCSIYEDRPEICRVMEPGCWACVDIRKQWGLG